MKKEKMKDKMRNECLLRQFNRIRFIIITIMIKRISCFHFEIKIYLEFKTNYAMIDSITQLVHTI